MTDSPAFSTAIELTTTLRGGNISVYLNGRKINAAMTTPCADRAEAERIGIEQAKDMHEAALDELAQMLTDRLNPQLFPGTRSICRHPSHQVAQGASI